MIVYLFLMSLGLPTTQVSHSGPPFLLSLLPSIIPPLFCFQMPSLHFPIIIYINVYITFLFTHHLLHISFFPSLLPLSPFCLFRTICGCSLLLAPLPTFLHHIGLFSYAPHPLHDPSHPLLAPLPPIFIFSTHF